MTVLLCKLELALGDAEKAVLAGGDPVLQTSEMSEALRLMAEERPSVVVVGGESTRSVADACQRLRTTELCRDAVLVAVGSERPQEVRILLDDGADDFVVGPAK